MHSLYKLSFFLTPPQLNCFYQPDAVLSAALPTWFSHGCIGCLVLVVFLWEVLAGSLRQISNPCWRRVTETPHHTSGPKPIHRLQQGRMSYFTSSSVAGISCTRRPARSPVCMSAAVDPVPWSLADSCRYRHDRPHCTISSYTDNLSNPPQSQSTVRSMATPYSLFH